MKIIKRLLLAVLVFNIFSLAVSADNTKYLLSDRELFECEAFADWVKENVDGAKDGRLSEWECLRVREINIAGRKEITSLGGIEIFQNLFSLDA